MRFITIRLAKGEQLDLFGRSRHHVPRPGELPLLGPWIQVAPFFRSTARGVVAVKSHQRRHVPGAIFQPVNPPPPPAPAPPPEPTTTKGQRPGWERVGKGARHKAFYRHLASGWEVRHCGGFSATRPWYAVTPDGGAVFNHNAGGFQHVGEAHASVERHLAGELVVWTRPPVRKGRYASAEVDVFLEPGEVSEAITRVQPLAEEYVRHEERHGRFSPELLAARERLERMYSFPNLRTARAPEPT